MGSVTRSVRSGVYRNDLPEQFDVDPTAFDELIAKVDRDLTFALEVENGKQRADVVNYDEVKNGIIETLEKLRDQQERLFLFQEMMEAIQLSRWLDEIEVVKVAHLGSYNCRKIRNSSTLSQHSFAKAIDITSLDDALVAQHWDDPGLQGQKLRTAALKACKYFSTILTPKSNKLHEKHFHLDNKPGLYKNGSIGLVVNKFRKDNKLLYIFT